MGNKAPKPASIELTPNHIALLRANTKFSDTEIRRWHAGFIRDCPNGRLDKKKFTEVYSHFFPDGNVQKILQVKLAFDAFDTDHNGTIDFDEFLLSVAAAGQGNLDDRLATAFHIYDFSDDGYIDQKELTNMISALYDLRGVINRTGEHAPKHRAAQIIAQLDISGDRKLSKAEFIAGCKHDPHIRKILVPNA